MPKPTFKEIVDPQQTVCDNFHEWIQKQSENYDPLMVNMTALGQSLKIMKSVMPSADYDRMMETVYQSKDKIEHHLIEDVAITIGSSIDKALGKRTGITRFSYASVPMDESLAEASLDLVKRPYSKISLLIKRNKIEGVSKEDIEHFFKSLTQNLSSCIHVTVKYGDNDHHKIEAAIKSLAVALRNASSRDKKQKGIPSTKGAM